MIRKILIVDDFSANRKLISIVLKKSIHDIDIIEANDGEEALEIIAKEDICVIILDIVMPRMNGLQVLQKIKSNTEYMHIPVIMCTANDEIESLEQALDLGALDYFTKPLTKEQLSITLPLKVRNAIEYYDQKKQLLKFYNHTREQIKLAESLQKSLITEHAVFQNAEIWGKYIPCEQIGGDMFCCKQEGDKFWFVIADISGHGIAAAMASNMLKVHFDYNTSLCENPGQLLQRINSMINKMFEGYSFGILSAFVGCLRNDVLEYANAGHPYPVFISGDRNEIRELEANGILVGIFEDSSFESYAMPLKTDDTIILYTDGIFDRGKDNDFIGWDLVRDYCIQNKAELEEDMENFLGNMCENFKKRGQNGFIDDVAVLAIKTR